MEERQQIEARLDARLGELKRMRLAMHGEGERAASAELAHLDNHPAEQATETHDEELELTTEIFFEEEERRIAEARRALADGTYGTCSGCHRPIPEERLAAVPEAVRCIHCQRLFEGGHRQRTRLP